MSGPQQPHQHIEPLPPVERGDLMVRFGAQQGPPNQHTAINEQQVGDLFLEIDWSLLAEVENDAIALLAPGDATATQLGIGVEPFVTQFFQRPNSYPPVQQGSELAMPRIADAVYDAEIAQTTPAWGSASTSNSVVSTFEQQGNEPATDQDATWNPAQTGGEEQPETPRIQKRGRKPGKWPAGGSRAERNKQSAARSRERKKGYITTLEQRVAQEDQLKADYQGLQLEYQRLQSQHAALKSHAAALELELAGYRRQSAKLKPS